MPQTIPLALAVAEKAFREFRNQWLCGLQPILSLETASDGQIHVLFKVVAGAGDATGQHEVPLHRGGVDVLCIAAKLNNDFAEEALPTDDDFQRELLLEQQLPIP